VPRSVLVADDDSTICQLIQFNLELEGYQVHLAHNGLDALDSAKANRPDLIVLDIMMPKLDGWDVLNAIRSDEDLRHTPVIMLTALAADNAVATSVAYGADVHLNKPFEPEELLGMVQRLIGLAEEVEADGT
jgi:CheY-like chemotaxis protein